MALKLNHSGLAHAHALIKAGKVDRGDSWSFAAEDGNRMLGADGKDWKSYAQMHLAEDTSEPENTKNRYKYPFGKSSTGSDSTGSDGEVYRKGVIAVKSRASQQGETEISNAADELLQKIDKKDRVKAKAVLLRGEDETFACVSDLSLMTEDVPTEIQILPIGEWKGYIAKDPKTGKPVKQTIKVTPDDVAEMVDNFKRTGRDIVIDYEHQTESGDEAPASGWIKDLINKGVEGLWGIVDWTDRALQYLRGREYRFFSPVFSTKGAIDNVTGKPIGAKLYNVALTNEPFIDNLRPIVAKSFTSPTAQESDMHEEFKKLFKAVCAALGHTPDDDLGDENVKSVHEKFKAHVASTGKVTKFKSDLRLIIGAGEQAIDEEILTIAKTKVGGQGTDVVTLKQRVDQLESEKRTKEATDAFNEAYMAGKIVPAVKDEALAWAKRDVVSFKAYHEKIARGSAIPIDRIETGSPAATEVVLTEEDKHICKATGITEAAFLKTKKEFTEKQRR